MKVKSAYDAHGSLNIAHAAKSAPSKAVKSAAGKILGVFARVYDVRPIAVWAALGHLFRQAERIGTDRSPVKIYSTSDGSVIDSSTVTLTSDQPTEITLAPNGATFGPFLSRLQVAQSVGGSDAGGGDGAVVIVEVRNLWTEPRRYTIVGGETCDLLALMFPNHSPGDVRAVPSNLTLGFVAPEASVNSTVRIVITGDQGFTG